MGSRTEVLDSKISNSPVARLWKLDSMIITMTADNLVLSASMPPVLYIDPGGAARDVLLPPIADWVGAAFIIFNQADAAEAITLKTSADAALTPAVDVLQNEGVIVHNDGTRIRALVSANT